MTATVSEHQRWGGRIARFSRHEFPLFFAAAVYLALTVITAAHHEPWRDEADVWLAARDSGISGFIERAAHAGTPPLWYVLVSPFPHFGFPFGSMQVLNLILATTGSMLALFGVRKVPAHTRIAFVFSYYPLYEYAVIARPYGLMYLSLILIALTYRRRLERPTGFISSILLLALSHGLGSLLAAGIGAVSAAEFLVRGRTRRAMAGSAALIVGIAIIGLMLWPKEGGQTEAELLGTPSWSAWRSAVDQGFFPGSQALTDSGVFLIMMVLLALSRRGWSLSWGVAGVAGVSYFYLFYPIQNEYLRHFGPVPLFAFVLLVVISGEQGWETAKRWLALALTLAYLYSAWFALGRIKLEWKHPYSGAVEAASFLSRSGLEHRPLAFYPAPQGSAVLVHLDREGAYYPGEDRIGSFMLWNRQYREGVVLPMQDVMSRVRCHFALEGGILVLSTVVPDPQDRDLTLLWQSQAPPFQQDESYLIFEVPPASGLICPELGGEAPG